MEKMLITYKKRMNNKEKYGEVFTPLNIVDEMMNHARPYIENTLKKIVDIQHRRINILDVGTGDGKFIKSFVSCYPELSLHVNFYGVEMNPDCEKIFHDNLKNLMHDNINNHNNQNNHNHHTYNIQFVLENFTEIDNNTPILGNIKYDLIMGNPPFNNQGFIKVPCNKKIKKTKEGKSIWHTCIKKSISLLEKDGYLLFVSPCLWLKPDKSNTYEQVINQCKLHFIKNYDSQESHKLFKYKAQTPVNYFLTQNINRINCETNETKDKVNHHKNDKNHTNNKQTIKIITMDNTIHDFELYYNQAIPTHHIPLVKQSQYWMRQNENGNLSRILLKSNPVDKTKYNLVSSIPSKQLTQATQTTTSSSSDSPTYYKNIKTCILDRETKSQVVTYEYSTIPCPYYQSRKIYCAHKRLPEFHADYEGNYGISKRDTYVISELMLTEHYAPNIGPNNCVFYLKLLFTYLNHEKIKNLCMCTKYRMNFLEKYAYEYIPNIVEYFLKHEDNDTIMTITQDKSFDYESYVNTFIINQMGGLVDK